MAINSKNRSFFLLLAIFFISLQKLFSVSSYTITTTDQQFKTFQSTNIVVVEEGYLLLSNHFEKINVVFRPSGRHSYSADYSSTTKKFFLFGGTENYPTYYNDCWIFDEETNQWQKISSSNTPQARYGSCIVNIGENKFLLFGGLGQQGYFEDTYIFSLFPSSGSFELVGISSHPSARYYHSMCFVPEENKVYLFGGYNQSGALNDLWCFDLSSSTWSFISTSNPPQPRCGHKMVYIDKKIYIFGGEALLQSTTKYNDLWVYDLQTKSFTDITPTTKPSARAHFGMAKFPELNQILIFGGHGNNYLNDLWFLNYISTTFAQSNPANSPSARDKFCFIKLKDKFFLYGGTS
jgi:N-acetylneuraminic acid mutarotase